MKALHSLAKQRVEQRLTLESDYDSLDEYMRLKVGRDGHRHRAAQMMVHQGNLSLAWDLLHRPECELEVWFGVWTLKSTQNLVRTSSIPENGFGGSRREMK